jgi:hypothetical protein
MTSRTSYSFPLYAQLNVFSKKFSIWTVTNFTWIEYTRFIWILPSYVTLQVTFWIIEWTLITVESHRIRWMRLCMFFWNHLTDEHWSQMVHLCVKILYLFVRFVCMINEKGFIHSSSHFIVESTCEFNVCSVKASVSLKTCSQKNTSEWISLFCAILREIGIQLVMEPNSTGFTIVFVHRDRS